MSTIQPKGENVRRAVKWISGERIGDDERPFSRLIQEASLKFNLTPKEEMFLQTFYEENPEG